MTVPRLISFPVIDQDALEQELAQYHTDATTGQAEVQTRSQAMLADAVEKASWLEAELVKIKAGRQRMDNNINHLASIRDTMKVTENDIQVELNAVNQIVTLLKAAGVTL